MTMRKMHRFRFIPGAKSHSGTCTPLIRFIVPNDSVADSEGSDQTVRMRRLICAFAVRICPKTRFHMAQPKVVMCKSNRLTKN